jgi:hypothetical protein
MTGWHGHQQPNTYRVQNAAYCVCGATLKLAISQRFDPDSSPAVRRFRTQHTGPGCAPCDSQTATQARRRERRRRERDAAKERAA